MKKIFKRPAFYIFIAIILAVLFFLRINTKNLTDVKSNQKDAIPTKEANSICGEQINQPEYKVTDKFEGTPSLVDFTKFPEAKTYYTVITKAVSSGSNFAEHFTVPYWGCGTDCFGYAVVDAKSGKIVAYSGANPEYHLRPVDLDSRVLILDPVNAGQERKYYMLIEDQGGKSHLELVCTEISSKDMYGPQE